MNNIKRNMVFIVIASVLCTFVLSWTFFSNQSKKQIDHLISNHNGSGRISGSVNYDGMKPEFNKSGKVEINIREYSRGAFFEKAKMIIEPSFRDGGTWMIEDVKEGVTYDVQAVVFMDGNKIGQSHTVTVTAPATKVELNLILTWKDFPEIKVGDLKDTFLSGRLNITGFVPDGAVYGIYVAPMTSLSESLSDDIYEPKFTKILNNGALSSYNDWKWNEASIKSQYLIRAELYTAQGDLIGTSEIKNVIVPQNNILLNINSFAKTEPIQKILQGTVTVNGIYSSDSVTKIQVRESGEDNFFDADFFASENTREWIYAQAKSGTNYDIRAVLERNGFEISKSHQMHVTAPAKNLILTIDANLKPSEPENRPEITACEKRDDESYDATIQFPGILEARSYWMRVGTMKYQGNIFSKIVNTDNYGDAKTLKMHLEKSKYYYTEYAYSLCNDCEDLNNFSEFTPALKFYCGEKPGDE